jgi:hypothetical protein
MTQTGWKSSAICAVLVVLAFAACTPIALLAPESVWTAAPESAPGPTTVAELPPGAKGAILDPAYFPGELAIIIGSYVGTVIIICILILTVGRRLRRSTQASPSTLKMEILKPVPINQPSTDNPWGPSPISPTEKNPRWPTPRLGQNGWNGAAKHQYQESVQSVGTFDESVIEEAKMKNEMEMDRLYAAVAEHEAERERASNRAPSSVPSEVPRSPLAQHPPELQHLRHGQTHGSTDSTRNLTQNYSNPPSTDLPALPPSRSSNKSPRRLHKPSPIQPSSPPSRTSSRSSYGSLGRKKSTSVRDLQISSPIPIPDWEDESGTPRAVPGTAPPQQDSFGSVQLDGGRRFHFAPSVRSPKSPASSAGPSPAPTPRATTFAIPPPPAIREQPSREEALLQYQQQQYEQRLRLQQSGAAPATPQSPREQAWANDRHQREQREQHNRYTPREQQARQQQEPEPEQDESWYPPRYQEQEPGRYTPRNQRNNDASYAGFNFQLDAASNHSDSPPPSATGSKRSTLRGNRPAPLPLSTATMPGSQSSLSLRTAPLPFRALRSPNSQRPPSMIKATEIERPERRKNNLLSPATGVPMTPYSPYMPMTPLTPMTPSRLITREERKRMKREEGRRVLTAADAVPEENELWG